MRSRSLVYLTYGDVDSPVYKTQVIGFCQFLEDAMEIPVELVAFVPLRLYFKQRTKLKRYDRSIRILPVINRWQGKRWYSKLNSKLLTFIDARSIMTRNPVAVHLCASLQERGWKYFYDARGCHYKELEEFSGASESQVLEMKSLEKASWKQADWVYTVSQQLVEHFKNEVRYRNHNHSVVPCCFLPTSHKKVLSKKMLFGSEEVRVFCYAGALSVWNFPRAFVDLTRKILKDPKNRLIILSNQLDELKPYTHFNSSRCIKKSVKHEEVSDYLAISDFGILLRKKAVTNQVASPSKFADYLSNGCKVIISPGIGDFTELVSEEDIGIVYSGKKDNALLEDPVIPDLNERKRITSIADSRFLRTSETNLLKYRNLKSIHDGKTN